MKPNPCKPDCPKRNATCHSLCPKYKEWRAEKDRENEQKNKVKQADRVYYEHRADYAIKCAKKRGAMK
jgi:hypothetical protein